MAQKWEDFHAVLQDLIETEFFLEPYMKVANEVHFQFGFLPIHSISFNLILISIGGGWDKMQFFGVKNLWCPKISKVYKILQVTIITFLLFVPVHRPDHDL